MATRPQVWIKLSASVSVKTCREANFVYRTTKKLAWNERLNMWMDGKSGEDEGDGLIVTGMEFSMTVLVLVIEDTSKTNKSGLGLGLVKV